METKTTGFIFLGTGVFIMTLSVILVVLGFLGIIKPSYFKASSSNTIKSNQTVNPSSLKSLSSENFDQNSLNQLLGQRDSNSLIPGLNLFSSGQMNDLLNLSAHFFLLTFIGGFGYKLAMIGTNLIRPIIVKTGGKNYLSQDVDQAQEIPNAS